MIYQNAINEKPAAKAVGFLARPARFERAAFRLGGFLYLFLWETVNKNLI
jgi:hypothetical protein